MSAPVTEIFTGGLVTALHPAQLQPGELQRADDCIYRDNDSSIKRAPGRIQLTSAAIGAYSRGMAVIGFDNGRTDQFVTLSAATIASPSWNTGKSGTTGAHLYACDFTAVTASALTPVEIGGQNQYYATLTGTSLNAQTAIASCVANGTTTVTKAGGGLSVLPIGSIISGTGVTAGTYLVDIATDTSITVSAVITSGTITLTFTQYPFLAAAQGCKVFGGGVQSGIVVTAVSNQDGTTGHYRTATLSAAFTAGNGAYTFGMSAGLVLPLENNTDEILNLIQYGPKKYYFWNGHGLLRALEWKSRNDLSSTPLADVLSIRYAGLNPVTEPFTTSILSGGSYAWNTTKGAGTYWFLITEIYSPEGDVATVLKDPATRDSVIESAYLATPAVATDAGDAQGGVGLPLPAVITTAASNAVRITFPAVVNNGTDGFVATHWGIYIYGPSATVPSLASMRRCATAPIKQLTAGQTHDLTEVTLTQGPLYPTVVATAASGRARFGHDNYILGAPDSLYGYSKTNNSGKSIPNRAEEGFKSYGFSVTGSYLAQTIYGMEAQIRGRANADGDTDNYAAYGFRLISGSLTSDYFYGTFGSQTNHTNIHGGANDTLGVVWTLASTGSNLIYMEIGIVDGGKHQLDLDSLGIKIYYSSNKVDFNGPAYRVVTYRNQVGDTVSDPARLIPPACSTADFFNGMLVSNDLVIGNRIKYSLPGEPEASPKPYFLTLNTGKKDTVTYIKTLGTILFVGMANSLKRVNYLPTEADTDMASGLAHEDIAADQGIPGPFCAVKFDLPGSGPHIAFASQNGLFITNGIWSRPLNVDLDWPNLVKVSALATAVMRVYAKEKLIAFFYCPSGATHSRNTRVLYFSYQSDKIKEGGYLPAVGPGVVSARAAAEGWLGNTQYLFTGNEADGLIYLEDSGLTIPAGYRVTLTATASTQGDGKAASATDVTINPLVRTRRIYPAGLEQDAYGDALYVLYSAYGTRTITAVSTPVSGSTTVTSSAAFGSVTAGMLVSGTGIDGGTIVLSKATSSSITISRAANTDAAASVTLTFDTGTIGVTIRSNGIIEAPAGRQTVYGTTSVGDLLALRAPEIGQGFELQFEKVPLTFDSNHDTATWIDLGVDFRIHQFTYLLKSAGRETNRATR